MTSLFEDGIAFVEGAFCPIQEARISLLDWGFLRSDACQDTVSVWNGAFFRLDDHLERFANLFHLQRHQKSSIDFRADRNQAFSIWKKITMSDQLA